MTTVLLCSDCVPWRKIRDKIGGGLHPDSCMDCGQERYLGEYWLETRNMGASKKEIHQFFSELVEGESDYEARMRMQDVMMEVLFELPETQRLRIMSRIATEYGKSRIFGRVHDFVAYMVVEKPEGGFSVAVTNDVANTINSEGIEFLFSNENFLEELKGRGKKEKFHQEDAGYATFRGVKWQIKEISGKTEFTICTASVDLIPLRPDAGKFGLKPEPEEDL